MKTLKKILMAAAFGILSVCAVRGDSTTSRLGLTVPDIGSTGWGTKINNDLIRIDSSVVVQNGTSSITGVVTFTVSPLFSFLTPGDIFYAGSGGLLNGTTSFFWDATNSRLGIGLSNPTAQFEVRGTSTAFDGNTGQMTISNIVSTATRMNLGYDTNIDAGYLQATKVGVGNKKLLLNANGGNVGIGLTNPAYTLDVGVLGQINSGIYSAGFGFYGDYFTSTTTDLAVNAIAGKSIMFTEDNNEWMRLTATGTLLVGTTIYSASTVTVKGRIESLAGGFKFPDGSVQLTASTGSGSGGNWTAVGSTGSIQTVGNVGIGTTVPTQKLHVYAGDILIDDAAGAFTRSLFFAGNGVTSNTNSIQYKSFADVPLTSDSGMIFGNKIKINSSTGFVGIGTLAPARATLHIVATTTTATAFAVGMSTFSDLLSISTTGATTLNGPLSLGSSDMSGNRLIASNGFYGNLVTSSGGDLTLQAASTFDTIFTRGGTEKIRLTATGLGIGTTNPSALLSVSSSTVSTDMMSIAGAFQTLPTTGYNRGTFAYQISNNTAYVSTETVTSAGSWKSLW